MITTARTLFAGIIDYAGIFPPARLPMEKAFHRFLLHRSGPGGGLLARFVCPASRLTELAALIERSSIDGGPIRVAALGAGGDDPPAFSAAIENDTEAMRSFGDRIGHAAVIDVFEVRLPREGDPSDAVDLSFHHLDECTGETPAAFFETPLVGDGPDTATVATAIAAAGRRIDEARRAGLKIRCGGLEASAVPSVQRVAAAVAAARDAELPLKATQGLHHPFRHHDAELETTVHGFINLVTASIAARCHGLDLDTIGAIVGEEDPAAFAITESALVWRELEIPIEAVRDGREEVFTGFGSCSFSEPRDDLATLGWL
jgi:hypothetical protein